MSIVRRLPAYPDNFVLSLNFSVYIYTDMLALFAESDFESPSATLEGGDEAMQDLTAHLTNTCLQDTATAKDNVFLLSDLAGKSYLSPDDQTVLGTLSQEQVDKIIHRIGEVVAETFKAGLGMPNHFSVSYDDPFYPPVLADQSVSYWHPRLHQMLLRYSASIFFCPHQRKGLPIYRCICSK